MRLTVQLHHDGKWHDAAELTIERPAVGHLGSSKFEYFINYFAEVGSIPLAENRPVVDARAASVAAPLDLELRLPETWPAFVLDMLPQGHARQKLSEAMGLDPNAASSEAPLLLRSGGAPVGNIRIKEAHDEELRRTADVPRIGVTLAEILEKSDRFLEVSEFHAMVASGSSGLQGEWPKIAMTLASDGLWYPDTLVEDAEARDHVIVKFNRGNRNDPLILEGEAGYAKLATRLGLESTAHRDIATTETAASSSCRGSIEWFPSRGSCALAKKASCRRPESPRLDTPTGTKRISPP